MEHTADITSAQDYYPFGMIMPGRSFNASESSTGFNGMMKDDEITGVTGSHYTAEYWEYDSRTGRRWNIDPEWQKYPGQSPYATFNCNPILYADPTGLSGIVTINKETKTITISAKIVLYGSGANKFLATTTALDIQNSFNDAHGKVKIDGVTYNVKANITGEYRNDDAALKKDIIGNKDFSNNYYRVESNTGNADNVSFNDDFGNTGIIRREEITSNGSTTEAHEFTHGLGLVHNSFYQYAIKGQPEIMDTRGDLAEKPYALQDGTLDFSTRKVTQKTINTIFNKDVRDGLKKYGTGGIGKLTNEYHEKPK
jgi:RHS repeat-associated protein